MMIIEEKTYLKNLKKFEKEYYNLTSNFNLNFPKVLNLREEKQNFFSAIADDKIYNPTFKFEKKHFDLKKFEQLKKFKIQQKNDLYGFKHLYKQRLKDKINEIYCHINWGKPESTKYVIKYRGKPSRLLLSRAKVFCKYYKRTTVKFKTLDEKIVASRLKNEVLKLTGNDINVVFVDIASKVNIIPNGGLMKINPNVRHTSRDVRRLKVHEIGVHYMRYYNGMKTGIKLLQTGTSNYIETEEGLAVYAEELKGVTSNAQMFIYAGRVIATFYALHSSFYDVFQILKNYGFRDEDAFAITFRAKRNISDTSKKGGFTKDYVYFSGYLKIKKYAKKHDLKDLFIGKIKIEDLKVLKKFIKKNRKKIQTIFD